MRALLLVRSNLESNPGGDTTQILETAAALRRRGLSIEISSAADPDLGGFDVVHLFHLNRVWENVHWCHLIRAAGIPSVLSPIYWPTEKFDRLVAASDGSDYPPLADLMSSWSDVSQRVFRAFSTVTHEQLVNPIAEMGAPHEEKNLLGVLAYVVWHETYHMGQIGTIRTQMGLTPMIDRAIEAWQASS